jgi:hypothetical protein
VKKIVGLVVENQEIALKKAFRKSHKLTVKEYLILDTKYMVHHKNPDNTKRCRGFLCF